jgi:hypothetical protein
MRLNVDFINLPGHWLFTENKCLVNLFTENKCLVNFFIFQCSNKLELLHVTSILKTDVIAGCLGLIISVVLCT